METIKTRNLPKGAKTKIDITNQYGIKLEQQTATYSNMDGAYGKRYLDDGTLINFNADFIKGEDGFYEII